VQLSIVTAGVDDAIDNSDVGILADARNAPHRRPGLAVERVQGAVTAAHVHDAIGHRRGPSSLPMYTVPSTTAASSRTGPSV
jgi:hypothetical protein